MKAQSIPCQLGPKDNGTKIVELEARPDAGFPIKIYLSSGHIVHLIEADARLLVSTITNLLNN